MQTMMATARLFEMDAEVSVSPVGSDSSIMAGVWLGAVSSSIVELVCEGDMFDDGLLMGAQQRGWFCTEDDSALIVVGDHCVCDSRSRILYLQLDISIGFSASLCSIRGQLRQHVVKTVSQPQREPRNTCNWWWITNAVFLANSKSLVHYVNYWVDGESHASNTGSSWTVPKLVGCCADWRAYRIHGDPITWPLG